MIKGLNIKDKICNNPWAFIERVLFVNILIVLCYIGLLSVYQMYPEGDIIEHIHVAYLTAIGEVPYRDFFEHHNPLLWYMFGWLVLLMEGNIEVIGIVSYITFLFFLVGCWFLYKIVVEFLSNKSKPSGLLSVILVLCPSIFLYYLYFKPDNYMFVSLTIGIYYLFCYIRDKKRKDIVISFFSFWVSFLFIQKALLYYPVIGVIVLYLLYKKELGLKDFCLASSIPVLGTLVCALVLYKMNMLELYWKSCFVFNNVMREHFGAWQVNYPFGFWEWSRYVFIVAGLFGLIFYKLENKYFRMLFWLALYTFLLKCFYFAPHVYYWYEAYYFAVPVAVVSVMRLMNENKMFRLVLLIALQVYVGVIIYCFHFDLSLGMKRKDMGFIYDLIEKRMNKCDKVYSTISNYNLFRKDLNYYWFIQGRLDIIGEKVGIHPIEDHNKIIEENKPKVLLIADVIDYYENMKGNKVYVSKIDYDMVRKYYDYQSNGEDIAFKDGKLVVNETKEGMYILKPMYDTRKCQYNKESGIFEYED